MANLYELKEAQVRLKLKEGPGLYSTVPIETPEAAVDLMKDFMRTLDREMVCILNLDNKLRAINFNVATIGGLNQSIVPMECIFTSSLLSHSSYVMMLHNHPSGIPEPSKADFEVTEKVIAAGNLLNIYLMDHVIIGDEGYGCYSFREHCPQMFDPKNEIDIIRKMHEEELNQLRVRSVQTNRIEMPFTLAAVSDRSLSESPPAQIIRTR